MGPEQREDTIVAGTWWAPARDDVRAEGEITALAEGLIWLDLASDPWQDVAGRRAVEPRALYGSGTSGEPMSLLGVRFIGGQKTLQGDRAHVRYLVGTLILGAHAETEDDVLLDSVRVSFRGLREWLMGGTSQIAIALPLVRPTPSADSNDEPPRTDDWVRSSSLEIDDVEACAFVASGPSRTGRFRVLYETKAWLQLKAKQPLTLTQWRETWVEPLRDLVLFGTREQTIVLSLSGQAQGLGPLGVRVYRAQDVHIDAPDHVEYHQRDLLPAGILGEDGLGLLIERWRGLHQSLGAVAQALFEVWNTADMPPLTRLLRLTSCAEGYHRARYDEPPFTDKDHDDMVATMLASLPEDRMVRDQYRDPLRYANRQSQRKRIRWLIDHAAEVDDRLARQSRDLTDKLVGWRNDQTHLDVEVTAPPLDDLLLLNAVLAYVLEANILLDLGIGDDTLRCLSLGHAWDDPIPAWLDSKSPENDPSS